MPTSINDQKQPKQQRWVKRHKGWSIAIGLLLLFCVIGALGGDKTPPASTTASTTGNTTKTADKSSNPASASTTPKLNQLADDGKIGFTATAFKCGVPQIEQVGDQYGIDTTSAKAPYCVLSLSMKGIGNQAQTFDNDAQFLYTANGTQYSADDDATFDANNTDSNCTLSASINPGVTVNCDVVFDVPNGTAITYAKLHDSMASNGIRVNLQ